MQSNLHSKEITTAQVASVTFGFFNDEEASAAGVVDGMQGAEQRAGRRMAAPHSPWRALGAAWDHWARRQAAGRTLVALLPAAACCLPPLPAGAECSSPSPPFPPVQVRKISVKQVVSPIIFDNVKSAVKGGLYDPAFGPMDPKER